MIDATDNRSNVLAPQADLNVMRTTTMMMAAALALASLATHAADNTLLIQIDPSGKFRVWHTEGENMLNEEDVYALVDSATPEGGAPVPTVAGMASAQRTANGVVVSLHDKRVDNTLLIDRDDCGGTKLWHGDGATNLRDEDLTELVLTALPEGGARMTIGENHARAFTARIGVIAVLWKPKKR